MIKIPQFKTLSIFVVAVLVILVAFYSYISAPTIQQQNGLIVEVHAGESKREFVDQLVKQGVLQHPILFSLYIYSQAGKQLKTGEYLFRNNASLADIWRQVTTGTGLYYRAFTIVPGWTFMQIRQQLAISPGISLSIATMADQQVMAKMGAGNISPEGQFYPDTFFYTKGDVDLEILQRAFLLMQKEFMQAWQNRDKDLPFKTPYEALIAASLVEREAYLNSERPVIAGVIINRLNKNMLLQIDPTVIYGMGQRYHGKITKQDLREDTPYNTYVHTGLPPTPIAIPSPASIAAILHPARHAYLYFVAKGDGGHQFSATLSQHNTAVSAAISRQSQSNDDFFNEKKIRDYLAPIFSRQLRLK